ncbi:MinD superfamily P-loop ATPase [Methanohalophilus levihalophilus]|uniref:ATP-binding protein n=1 Tax=Methanohalophilus levihalophilus TaxID=1431282 RepID=UPI001AEA2A36|nr:ATP-binding protein [Methanohalophilus levihalophilus]MBP2030148.1 MinD superfamily P-loop ATPase [Methanohalophilus levihalophilus]
MKQLAVISGKGGTGKTTIAAAFVSLAKKAIIADCDVDASNMHLVLKPEILKKHDFYALPTASIEPTLCMKCNLCRESCRFGAIEENFTVEGYRCEGCGVCEYVCPVNAIKMQIEKAGEAYESGTRFGPMAHAKLGIGEEASGKLVTMVRELAIRMAEEDDSDLIIIDGPPGTGCSVIATLTGADAAFVVTEPTISGIHDLGRVLEVASHFRIPAFVCINKSDLNEANVRKIEEKCDLCGATVVGKLPFDKTPTEAMIEGKTVVEYASNTFSSNIKQIWNTIKEEAGL